MTEVKVAENSGFCFGVGRATDKVEYEMKNRIAGEKIYTLGRLIHNDTYNARLKAGGVEVIEAEDIEKVAFAATSISPVKVFVRAHGMTADTESRLEKCSKENPNFSFVDCTCSYVKKIHKIVKENSSSEGLLLVLGSAEHPEVVGFCSRFEGKKLIFSNCDDLENSIVSDPSLLNCAISPIVVAQTTQNLCEWEKTKKYLKKVYTKPIIFDTICSVTEKRQLEAIKLAQQSDFMVVIGSRGSSNSAKLYSICKAECDNTIMIESAAELKPYGPFTYRKIGIAAGASTPSDIIQEVEKTMSEVENFAELIESSLKTLNTGDTVTGYVTAVNDGEIQLDIGAKVTGIIKADQITDDLPVKLTTMFKVGDKVDAFVIRVSDVDGVAELSKKRTDSDKNWNKLVEARENDEVVEGTVISTVKGGIIVLVYSNRVFVHESQTGLAKGADLSTMVGQTVKLKLTDVKTAGQKRARGSIRVVLRDEKRKAEEEFWAGIEEGKQFTGKVKSLTSYGAFVDIGGIDGMVHVSELSWKRLKAPSDVLSVGDEITVFVKSFDREKKKISLGYRTEESNPWYIFTHKYAVGDIAEVKIVSMMPFGAFAEIVDGVDGLIHISQIALTKIAKPADVLEIGQIVDAKITEIDNEKKKVNLSIRALLEEAKAEAEAAPAEEATETPVEE